MSREIKYIGMDVHKEAIVIAVLNHSGTQVMESIVATQASSILQFIHGLQGELHVTWEEGTWAAWLYDLLKPHVHQVLVCNPRSNALLKEPLTATLQAAFACPHRDPFRQDYNFHNLDCGFSGGTTDGTSNVSSSRPTLITQARICGEKVKP